MSEQEKLLQWRQTRSDRTVLIATQGLAGCGKSTLSRALSGTFGWPLLDKDDIKDLLDDRVQAAGPLAYELMCNLARRQLLQGLSVICDSPLTGCISYQRVQQVATETHASLVVLTCMCSDEETWKQRINSRKILQLPAHHQSDWEAFELVRRRFAVEAAVVIRHPQLIIDTVRPLHECLQQVIRWLASSGPGLIETQKDREGGPHGPRS